MCFEHTFLLLLVAFVCFGFSFLLCCAPYPTMVSVVVVLTVLELHSVAQASLKLKRSDILCLSSAGVKGVHRVPSLPSSS